MWLKVLSSGPCPFPDTRRPSGADFLGNLLWDLGSRQALLKTANLGGIVMFQVNGMAVHCCPRYITRRGQ
ncbi:hypothetical protein OF001_U300028 [Pseudomonas sp. OF001]|nr:hypothetical protein OF001_U300028 [Pseudomonas sp. OF001]